MIISDENIEIGVVLYPDVQASAVSGLTDLFQIANLMSAQSTAVEKKSIRVTHWGFSSDEARWPERVYDSHKNNPVFEPNVLIAPPSLAAPISTDRAARFGEFIRRQHENGCVVSSVCAGAFLLGEANLLDGRAVTTHWIYANEISRRFPKARVASDRLIVDLGDLLTAGGLMSWIDLGLTLVARFLGPQIMMETARFMVVDPPGGEQRPYSNFVPNFQHCDENILKVQTWLHANSQAETSVAILSDQAGLKVRTFIRRFQKATGFKPTEYCQHLRVGKARQMLEQTNEKIEQIAWASGYEDAGSFRKTFSKLTGLPPAEYRKRFSITKSSQPRTDLSAR